MKSVDEGLIAMLIFDLKCSTVVELHLISFGKEFQYFTVKGKKIAYSITWVNVWETKTIIE